MGRPLRVGLTGGIGSGKSHVARLFATLGAPIIDADQIAREHTQAGTEGLADMVALLGPEILDVHGALRRDVARKLIFEDSHRRRLVENALHPRIRATMHERAQQVRGPYCILVIPLLVESRQIDLVDRVLLIDASPETQIRRVRARDTLSTPEIGRILDAQASHSERLQAADDIIENNDEGRDLMPVIERLHRHYVTLGQALP